MGLLAFAKRNGQLFTEVLKDICGNDWNECLLPNWFVLDAIVNIHHILPRTYSLPAYLEKFTLLNSDYSVDQEAKTDLTEVEEDLIDVEVEENLSINWKNDEWTSIAANVEDTAGIDGIFCLKGNNSGKKMIVTFGNTVSSTTTKIEEQLFKANLLNQYMVRKKRRAVEDLGAERQKSLKIEQKFGTYPRHYKVYKRRLRV